MEDTEIELEVTRLMQELQTITKNIEILIAPYEKIMEEATNKIEEISLPYKKNTEIIETRIKELILLRAKSLKTGSGNVTYKKGAVRRSWDLDALDGVCDRDVDVKNRIWNYRKETIGEPSVTIKVDTEGTSITNI